MSGFGSAVGFMFSFFILAFTFSAIFYSYQTQVNDNSKLILNLQKDPTNFLKSGYEILNPFYMSGRLNFQINNSKSNILKYFDKGLFCFSFFQNNNYIKNSNLFFNILKPISKNYKFIEKGKIGIFSPKLDFNSNIDNSYKLISCDGQDKYFSIKSSNQEWYDSNWNQRKRINITNNANINLAEYQVEINLNSSNFDFSKGFENEIRFIYPLKYSLVLDTPFDKFSQTQEEFSSFSNLVNLGTTSGIEITDPQNTKGIILDGLSFDGIDDKITINANKSLELNNSLTFSAWIRWNGAGNTFQNIFSNGDVQNSLRIVNDGGVNNNKILFQLNISGVQQYLYSNVLLDSNWHFITSTYDGSDMKIYLDFKLVGSLNIVGNVKTLFLNNYIGSNGNSFYFNGTIDEVKIFNIDLKQNEIENLYYNNLRFRDLNFYFSNFDGINQKAKTFVKIPAIQAKSSVLIDMYYDNRNSIFSKSNIENTFNYTTPRTVGYVLSDRISLTTGLNIMSLYNNNTILVGNNVFNQNEQIGATLGAASINLNDKIKMKYLAQVDGQADADDIITPISWAGTKFYYRGFRKAGIADRFCMISPWGNSWIQIRAATILKWNGTITNTGSCISLDITTSNNLAINSTIPILVSYYGNPNQDPFVFYPATNEDLYGMPSASGFLGTGSIGLNLDVYRSFGTLLQSYTIGSFGTASFSGGGTHGTVAGHKLVSTNGGLMGAIQQADGDGSDSTVFVPKKEFGVKFGSNEGNEYIALVSDVPDANCSSYDSLGVLKTNIVTGTGQNGVYNYSFDVGNSITYLGPRWKVECSKPVWGYFEEDVQGDETNFITHPMMRQYIYPQPTYTIN